MTLALLVLAHPIGLIALLGIGIIGMATVGPLVPLGTLGAQAVAALGGGPPVLLAASGAINPHVSANYFVTKSTAAALTIGAPTAGADDGVQIAVYSTTAAAHTITGTGLLNDGNSSGYKNVITFNAHIGASATLFAYNGAWYCAESGGSITS
jgi:hypothetical protein